MSDRKTIKRKDTSKGENPTLAPNDGRLDTLPDDMHREKSHIVVEPTELVNIGIEEQPKIIHFAKSLTPPEKTKFVPFFKRKQVNFAWSYVDMPGLDLDLILHHLPLDLGVKPVKHKLRKMHPHITLLVKELKKLLDVGFIRAIDYLEWVSNIVPVSKLDGRVRLCNDFRDLNKAYCKDDFLLPNIDIIVNLIAWHKMLSLMDGFLGYNQIKIAPEDQHKTTFTCPWGTFC